jgi:hypothetical protein
MRKNLRWMLGTLIMAGMLGLGSVSTSALGQPADPQATPNLTPEQQKQLDQLKQLEDQLQKDREALHSAIAQFGWDSEQVDMAQEKLLRDRAEYRKLRRSLRAAGVAVPSPSGIGAGPQGGREGRWASRRDYRGGGRHHCGGCPCCGW